MQDTLLSINLFNIDLPTQREVDTHFPFAWQSQGESEDQLIIFFSLQIDLFIQAIEMNPAVVSLKGYADVNRELLTSVISFDRFL